MGEFIGRVVSGVLMALIGQAMALTYWIHVGIIPPTIPTIPELPPMVCPPPEALPVPPNPFCCSCCPCMKEDDR